MVQAYRDGLLRTAKPFKWSSHVRQAWLTCALEQENDAETALQILQFKSGFATLVADKQKMLEDTVKLMQALGQFAEGDPTAMLSLKSSGVDLAALQQLWRALREEGIVS